MRPFGRFLHLLMGVGLLAFAAYNVAQALYCHVDAPSAGEIRRATPEGVGTFQQATASEEFLAGRLGVRRGSCSLSVKNNLFSHPYEGLESLSVFHAFHTQACLYR